MSEKVKKLRHFLMTYNFNQLPKPYKIMAMSFAGQLIRLIDSEQDVDKVENGIKEFLDSLDIFANIINSGHLPNDIQARLSKQDLELIKKVLEKMDVKTRGAFLKFLQDIRDALK
jgi:hypothetical protein